MKLVPAGPSGIQSSGPVWVDDQPREWSARLLPDRTPEQPTATLDRPGHPGDDRGSVPLRAETRAHVDLERVPRALEASDWLGEEIDRDERGMRRVLSDLVLGVGAERPIAFRRSMLIALGRPRQDADGWTVPIEWQASSLTPLFPVFVGEVRIGQERVTIEGRYAPPFGVIGAVLDRALLGIAARGTAKVILGRFVEAVSA
jgi:hypothetical protein